MTANVLHGDITILSQSGGAAWWVWGGVIAILAALVLWLVSQALDHRTLDTLQAPDREPDETGASDQAPGLDVEQVSAALTGSRVEAIAGSEEPFQPYHEAEEPDLDEGILPSLFAQTGDDDDLKRIHGITPGVASVLNAAGIHTFAQLSSASPVQLEKILRSAGMRLSVDHWPEQARLAAEAE